PAVRVGLVQLAVANRGQEDRDEREDRDDRRAEPDDGHDEPERGREAVRRGGRRHAHDGGGDQSQGAGLEALIYLLLDGPGPWRGAFGGSHDPPASTYTPQATIYERKRSLDESFRRWKVAKLPETEALPLACWRMPPSRGGGPSAFPASGLTPVRPRMVTGEG